MASRARKVSEGECDADEGAGPVGTNRKAGVLRSLRASLSSPMTSRPLASLKGSKGKSTSDLASVNNIPNSIHTHTPPPSPSLSLGSPLRGLSGMFQKRDAESGGSKTTPTHVRISAESSVALGDMLLKKGASLRRSLRLRSSRHASQSSANQESLQSVTEADQSDQSIIRAEVTKRSEVRESYVLPEIPHTPLSVMQIHKLIELEVLEEAHLNLLSLREEFVRQQGAPEEEVSPVELAHLEKDLHLLYGALQNKMAGIVRQSSALPARNKELLVQVARVVQEEERREQEGQAGGLGGWREAWREAVRSGVQDLLQGVHLDTPEHNTSWLAVHLGLLGKAIVEHLERVKAELKDSYPPTFHVFDTYVTCVHQVTEQHLQRIMGRVTELKDFHALLDFITHRYKSERIMGSFSLRPELKEEQRDLRLQEAFNTHIRTQYTHTLQVDLRNALERVCVLEREECWEEQLQPRVEDGILQSHITMDICTSVKSYVMIARRIDADLEQRVVHTCLSELLHFPRRFEGEFLQWSSSLLDHRLWVEYSITYINAFSSLREHMESYRGCSPDQVTQLDRELEGAESRLREALLQHFLIQTKPLLRRMMTAKWLSTDEDFQQLTRRIQELRDHSQHMVLPHAQELASVVHMCVMREYVASLMRGSYRCSSRKQQCAATKIRQQGETLNQLFKDMRSTADWLHPLSEHLSNLIGQKHKSDIKTHLQPLVQDFPDISKRHVSAVLLFRGMARGRERQRILQRLSELKREFHAAGNDEAPELKREVCGGNDEASERRFFSSIEAASTACLTHTPFSCFTGLLPHT
ncbi:hypothetical protein ACEWY4_005838 [Coilia grayii]|uniref:Exocyst complex component Sec6 n=1 Tax=Coilia grayii TaxID=363190 RepID=A0ABD1KJP0_9TELE